KDIIRLKMMKGLIRKDSLIKFTIELSEKNAAIEAQLKDLSEEAIRKFVDENAVLDINTAVNISKFRNNEGKGEFPGQGHRNQKDTQEGDEELLSGVKNIIAVASRKGGVGKSTVAVNLACGLARTGAKVGLLDTDIYGPSIPTMMDMHQRPNITTQKKLIPLKKYGIRFLSMGVLVDPDQAMIWRGPMVTSAVKQFMEEVQWGDRKSTRRNSSHV